MLQVDPLALAGTTLGDRLRVDACVGPRAGGWAYDAFDLALQRAVGLLVVPVPAAAEGADEPARDAFFARFAEVEGALQGAAPHPGRVGVLAGGADRERGFAFLVLEGVSGPTLLPWLARRREAGPFDPLDAFRLLLPLAEVLADAHAGGVVHGRLEPTCVVVHDTPAGPLPYLLGHGIAAALAAADPAAAFEPAYGAPEHWAGGPIGVATDVWAFGRLLVEAMVGAPLFPEAASRAEIEAALRDRAPPTPAALGLVVPPGVEALASRALAREPAARFADGAELLAAMRALLPPPAPPPPAEPPAHRRPSAALLAVGGVLTVLTTLAPILWPAYLGWRAARSVPPPPPTAAPRPTLFASAWFEGPEPVLAHELAFGTGRWHWRVTWAAGGVERLEEVAPDGSVRRTVDVERTPAGTSITFADGAGHLTRVDTWAGSRGKRALVEDPTEACVSVDVRVDAERRPVERRCLDALGRAAPRLLGCDAVLLSWDASGQLASRRCLEGGAPRPDLRGVHEERYAYDAEGYLARVDYRDAAGAPARDREGCGGLVIDGAARLGASVVRCANESQRPDEHLAWSVSGCLTERAWRAGGAVVLREGFATLERTFDRRCAVTAEWATDERGAELRRGDLAPRRTFTRDGEARVTEERCAARGAPAPCRPGGAATRITHAYEPHAVRLRGTTEAGAPASLGPDGHVAEVVELVDGQPRAIALQDAAGAPPARGVARIALERGPAGELTAIVARDPVGREVAAPVCAVGVCLPPRASRLDLGPLDGRFLDASGRPVGARDCARDGCPLRLVALPPTWR